MASNKFPFGSGLPPMRPFWPEGAQAFPVPSPYLQRTLSIPEAIQLTELEWNEIKKRINHLNSALTKLLGKSTERPTLMKITSSWKEKRETLTIAEAEVLQKFFSCLDRLEKVKNALPIGLLLKDNSIDINAILSATTVHSTVHEEVTAMVEKGVQISSRFKATVSVIPRLLDSFSSSDPHLARSRVNESSTRARSPSPGSQSPTSHPQDAQKGSTHGRTHTSLPGHPHQQEPRFEVPGSSGSAHQHTQRQEKVRRESGDKPNQPQQFEEIPLGALLGDPDADFQMLQMVDGMSVFICLRKNIYKIMRFDNTQA